MKKLWKSIKEFFIAEFTKEVCDKHPTARMSKFIGCVDCYKEACAEDYLERREARIEEMKEAIIRANNAIKEPHVKG
jgi:hypothetical protein